MPVSEVPNPAKQVPPGPAPGKEPKGHGWVWVVLVLMVVIAAAAYRMRSHAEAGAKNAGGDQPISVGVTPVEKGDLPYYLTGLGSVTAFNTVTVRTRVDGQIMKIYFQEGQFVQAGDPLLEIDPRPYQVALDQAEGQLAKDMASQKDAQIDLGRYQQLWQEGVIPRQQVDTQQALVGQYDGAIQSDQAQTENEKLQLSYCHIVSPIDGRIGLRLVDPGNIVHATDANGMLVITEVKPIAVLFTLPEDNLPQVVSEMRRQTLAVEAYSRDDNTKLASGTLLTLDNQIDQTTGTIKLKSEFGNDNLMLWPNQFVNVRLYLNTRKGAIVVPSAAVQKGAQGMFVYVVGADNKADVRPVQVAFSEGNLSAIQEGLRAGEQVVIDGADKLQPGAPVVAHPLNPSQAAGANAASELHP